MSEFCMASLKMHITAVRCAEEVRYQQQPEVFLANWWHDENVSTIPDVVFSDLDED